MNYKYLAFAAMAGAALVGCTKTELTTAQGSNDAQIKFATPVHTRAEVFGEITGTSYNTQEKFAVWGILTRDNKFGDAPSNSREQYMGTADAGIVCTYNGTNAWYPAKDYYWPKSGYLTFVAVSPSDVPNATFSLSDGLKVTNYTTPKQDNQYDLMFSDISTDWEGHMFSTGDNDDNTGDYEYIGVDLKFNHALSSVNFTVCTKLDYSPTEIAVKSIKLKNVNQKGTLTADLATSRQVQWTMSAEESDKVDYSIYSSTMGVKLNVAPAGGAPKIGKTYLLIPQDLTNVVVEVTYDQKNAGGALISDQKVQIPLSGNKYTENGTEYTITEWEMGRRYTYNLIFGLNKIYFDPATVGWLDTSVSLPFNPGA